MKACDLLLKTIDLLNKTNVDELSYDLRLSRSWLYRLRAGGISDPSVNKIVLIYEYLTKKVIEIK